MDAIKTLAVSVCCLALAACGGDGGSGVASTPVTPTSPTAAAPVNANPFQPTANESFVNDAVTGTISGTTSGALAVGMLGTANLTIKYDATAKTYALSAGSASFTAGASNLLPQVAANTLPWTTSILFYSGSLGVPTSVNVYGSGTGNGSSVEQVLLTTNAEPSVTSIGAQNTAQANNNPFPPSDLTLSYVAAGSWTKASVSGSTVSGSQTQFVYGAYTTDSQMPRTGSAAYAVAISGTYVTDSVKLMQSYGTLNADFATGVIAITSTISTESSYSSTTPYSVSVPPTNAFTASATMSSKVNSFSGTFSYNGSVPVSGTLNGKFYGPAAQEVGATFSGSNANAAVLGSIVGSRGSTPIK